jgi:hypothetical protein
MQNSSITSTAIKQNRSAIQIVCQKSHREAEAVSEREANESIFYRIPIELLLDRLTAPSCQFLS